MTATEGITLHKEKKLLAEFMGFPEPKVGSSWDYDRSLDNAENTTNLIIKELRPSIGEQGVNFEQWMPYQTYGISYFDGRTFYPSGKTYKFKPCSPFNTNWDYLMPVILKINELGKEFHFAIFKTYFAMTVEKGGKIFKDFSFAHSEYFINYKGNEIEGAYRLVVKFLTWYNQNKPA